MMAQRKISSDEIVCRILNKVAIIAEQRYPNARGYNGHMMKIAREEFGVRLTQDIENDVWGDVLFVVDEQRFTFAQLKY